MQNCAVFISAESLYMFRAQAPIQKCCIIDKNHTYKPQQNTHPSQHVNVNMLYILQNTCNSGRCTSFKYS